MGNKKYKYILIVLIVGMLFSITFNVFAETSSIISVFLKNNIKFEFNGEHKELPDEYVVLNYNGRTYVPARFIAEELGAEVQWDAVTNTINIVQEKQEDISEEINEDIKQDESSKVEYKEIPVSKSYHDMLLGITLLSYDNNYWRVYLKLENKGNIPLQLLPSETKIEVDDKEYDIEDAPIHYLDTRWYNDIKEDDDLEGYIVLPKLHKEPENLHIEFKVLSNNEKQEKRTIEFDVKF